MTDITLNIPDWVGYVIVVLCWLLAANMLTEIAIAWMRRRAEKRATAEFQRIVDEATSRLIRERRVTR